VLDADTPIPSWSLVRRVAGSSALYAVAGASGKALALFTVPFLSRSLGPSGYGLADLAASLAAVITVLVMFAGDIPAARLAGVSDEHRRNVLRNYVGATALISSVVAILLMPLAGLIASGLWGEPRQGLLVLLALALVPISASEAALASVQRIAGAPWTFALVSTFDLLAQLGLAVTFVALGWGPYGVLGGFVAGSGLALCVALVFGWQNVRGTWSRRIASRIITEGLPFVPATVAFMVADYATRYLVLDKMGEQGVGYFALSIRLASIMSLAVGAFSLAWGPVALALQPGAVTAQFFGRAATALLVGISIVALLLGAFAPEVVGLVSGSAFRPAAGALAGLLFTSAIAGVFFVVLVAAGVNQSGRLVAGASIAGSVVQVLGVLLLLPAIGFPAVGVGSLAGRLTSLGLLAGLLGHDRFRVSPMFPMAAGLATLGAIVVQWQTAQGAPLPARLALTLVASALLATMALRSSRSGTKLVDS
jgi:O-antigen/teichoic acid export membrane protein